ncbi:hypothetical protein WR25_14819 isoform E [Diploscapter pachys]|uniref:Presenilin n=1 Tax=Diploscapter pachys TaxID=2018661 RepID=A0A2A2L822_9BILA|nr:hypothetical protein WR25_14819 isoform E [Diploscapter pachys]
MSDRNIEAGTSGDGVGMTEEGQGQATDRKIRKRKPAEQSRNANNNLTSYGTTTTSGPVVARNADNDDEEDEELKYGARHVIYLFIPVSICMAFVVFTLNTVSFYTRSDGRHLLYTPFVKETDSASEKMLMSLGNALVMLFVIAVMTLLLILFYKYRCYKVIHGWLIVSSFLLLFLFTSIYLQEVMRAFNVSLSIVSVGFFLINYGAVGMMVIHWKGPLKLQQFYLITMSALMALVFIKYLPEWTVWSVLAVISIWDLVAVLAPQGPLRILVETAQERNEPIFPALIYSSGILYPYVLLTTIPGSDAETTQQEAQNQNAAPNPEDSREGEAVNTSSSTSGLLKPSAKGHKVKRLVQKPDYVQIENTNSPDDRAREAAASLNRAGTGRNGEQTGQQRTAGQRLHDNLQEEKGVKLGLGDFIFYSVLVGKASSYFDWNTTVACYIAILIGLAFTLVLLAVFKVEHCSQPPILIRKFLMFWEIYNSYEKHGIFKF